MQNEVAVKGKKYYDEKLKQILEPDHFGEFISIDVESGEYFLGKTDIEAIKKGSEVFPGKKLFLVRVGSQAAYKIGGFNARTSR